MKLSIKTLLNYAAVLIIFTEAGSFSSGTSIASYRISYLIIAVILMCWLPVLKGLYFNKTFLFLFSIIILFSFYNVFMGNDTIVLLAKQIVGIFLSSFIFYLLIKINRYDLKGLFKIYLNIAFLVGLIGIFQELFYILGFKPGYDYSSILPYWTAIPDPATGLLRVNSILPEPAFFCNAMMPAFFTSLVSFLKNSFRFISRWKSFIIIVSFLLSFSLTGYMSIFISMLIIMYSFKKFKYIITALLFIFVLYFFSYNYVPVLRMKFTDSVKVLCGNLKLSEANQSTFAVYSNALVAYNSFKNNPLCGSGLGSHEISYFGYVNKFVNSEEMFKHNTFFTNYKDAASLFLRLLSETGLFGVSIIIIFIFKFYVNKKEDKSNYLWIISNAILVMFFLQLARYGHYFNGGLFFFFWLYYFAGKSNALTKIKLRKGIHIDEDTPCCPQPEA